MKHQAFLRQIRADGVAIWASVFEALSEFEDAIAAIAHFDAWLDLRRSAGFEHPCSDEFIIVKADTSVTFLETEPPAHLVEFRGSAADAQTQINIWNNDE